jgi:hypothetical protein
VSNAYAIVIGIERYQQSAIPGIDYAHADARAMTKVLEECFGVLAENIKVWLDSEATYVRLKNELKYDTSQLEPDDRFYFFYAGHGFWSANGGNRLTAWDTHLSSTEGTTVSIEDVLLNPLREARCKTSALFIDACAEKLATKGRSRDLLTGMRREEFDAFSKTAEYLTAFFACKPEEKSWSSSTLKHGVWTYHLERALRGEAPEAIYNEAFITNTSLQNYLYKAVRKFVRDNMETTAHQTPYAVFHHTSTAALVTLPEPPPLSGEPLLNPDFSKAYFVKIEKRYYKWLPGFNTKKGHTVPAYHSDRAAGFARQLLSSEVSEELQAVVRNAREVLTLKYRDLKKDDDGDGAGTVDADAFRFQIDVSQNKNDHTEAVVRREVRLREQYSKLPENFDSIFPEEVDTLVIPLRDSEKGFIELRDAIEERDSELEADEATETIKFRLDNGMNVKIDMKRGRMILKKPGIAGALSLIETFAEGGGPEIAGPPPKLIGKIRSDE